MKSDFERLRELRKHFKLSQTEFAEKLGVTRSIISNLELGVVEIKDHMFKLIAATFGANEEWLRNGAGEMFMQTPQTILDDLVTAHNLNGREKAIISAFLDLSPEGRAAIIEYVEKAARGFAEITTVISREDMIAERISAADKKIAEEIGIKKQ